MTAVRTLYGLKPSVVFEASVHILRQNIPAAKDIVSGDYQSYLVLVSVTVKKQLFL